MQNVLIYRFYRNDNLHSRLIVVLNMRAFDLILSVDSYFHRRMAESDWYNLDFYRCCI